MVEIRALSKIWHNGRLVDWGDARVHVLSHGLHYAYAVFEGIRAFDGSTGPSLFRLPEHLDRFENSARIYRMKLPYSGAELRDACREVVRVNGLRDAYIRPIAFSGYGQMGLDPSKAPIEVAVAAWEWGAYLGAESVEKGVRATISSWTRIDSRSLPPQAKCAANYANGALAKMEAKAGGYDEAILLNTNGMVAEGSGENIFKVKRGVVSTPPASSGILRGITRDTVMRLVGEAGLTFHRSDFTREDLFSADELFFAGTAVGLTPIREVDGRLVGDGTFPITRGLQQRYEDVTRGRSGAHPEWRTSVGPARSPAPLVSRPTQGETQLTTG